MTVRPSRNLILGAIWRMEFELLKPFLLSLGRTGYNGHVVFFASEVSQTTSVALRDMGVTLLTIGNNHPLTFVRINTARYYIYQSYLAQHGDKYSHVLLTDVRDVFFQRNPFDFPIGDALLCFLEDARMTLGSCEANSNWLRAAYGEEVLRELGARPVSCSGTTLGSVGPVMEYLKKMAVALARVTNERPLRTEWGLTRIDTALSGVDQASHNHILYKDPPQKLRLIPNESGPIMALHHRDPETIRFNDAGQVINAQGDVVHVLHQYDRHKALTARLHQALGLSPPVQP